MPKRTSQEKIEYYQKKIKKLEGKQYRRLKHVISSDSEENPNSEEAEIHVDAPHDETGTTGYQESSIPPASPSSPIPSSQLPPPIDVTPIPEVLSEPHNVAGDLSSKEQTTSTVDLDPSILAALGEITSEIPEFGEKIHENLAKIWLPLLKKGMTKENRETLLKNYLVPENCTLLQAPALNPEIQAAIPDSGKYRDKKMTTAQQQLGAGITAVNRGLDLLINGENKVNAIKAISDGCRILSDLHYQNTTTRIKFITPCLDKTFLQIVERSERDNTLFGSNLSDKISASKAIEKQSKQIKKSLPTPKTSTSNTQPTATKSNYQGNWSGPSRFQSNRGRGGYKQTNNRAHPVSTQ